MKLHGAFGLGTLLALILLAAGYQQSGRAVRADDDDRGRNSGFGSQIAGTYVAEPTPGGLLVVQIHADGTVSGTDGNNFEGASGGVYGSPVFGSNR